MSYPAMIMSPIIVMFSIFSLLLTRKHFLMCLLNLEVMILGLVVLTSTMIFYSANDTIVLFILLTLGACEASLGLSCLVKMSRSFGNDNLLSMSTSLC